MERVVDINDLVVLRDANACLSSFLDRSAGLPIQGSEKEIEDLREVECALISVAPLLQRQGLSCPDPDVRTEFVEYRQNLVKLRQELGRLQSSAEECRARVLGRQRHLHSAKAWCVASRDIAR